MISQDRHMPASFVRQLSVWPGDASQPDFAGSRGDHAREARAPSTRTWALGLAARLGLLGSEPGRAGNSAALSQLTNSTVPAELLWLAGRALREHDVHKGGAAEVHGL